MLAPSARTAPIAVAALALIGTAAFGQQLFQSLDDERRAYLSAQCDHIKDGAQQVGCMAQKSIEFDRAKTEAAKQRMEDAKQGIALEAQLQRCIAFLKEKRDGGAVFDRKITRDNVCPYARELGRRDGPG